MATTDPNKKTATTPTPATIDSTNKKPDPTNKKPANKNTATTIPDSNKKSATPNKKPANKNTANKNHHYHNSPVIGDAGYNLIPEDEIMYVAIEKELRKMAEHPPDLHCRDTELLEGRINDFFNLYASFGLKPPVTGLAMALGINRKTLWAIVNDAAVSGNGYKANLPPSVSHAIKFAYESLEIRWEMYMMHGKINPVTGIFLGKNQFGYRDQTEVVIPQSQAPEVDAEEIKRRYLNGEMEENNSVFDGEMEESGQIALDNMGDD